VEELSHERSLLPNKCASIILTEANDSPPFSYRASPQPQTGQILNL